MNRLVSSAAFITSFACAVGPNAQAQEQPKARINITVTENGETKRLEREIPLNDPAAIEQALREMGVMDELEIDGGSNRIEINIRKRGEEGVINDMDMSMFMEGPEDAVAWSVGEPRAYLGVYTGNWNQSTCEDDKKKNKNNSSVKEGACITHVVEGSAAEKAGLKEGDVIVAIGEKELSDCDDLTKAIRSHKPGDAVEVTYWRDGKKSTTTATLGQTEDESYAYGFGHGEGPGEGHGAWSYSFSGGGSFLGVVPGGSEDGGLLVEDVVDGSSAQDMDLRKGDIIKEFNGTTIDDFEALVEAVERTEPGAEVKLTIEREGKREQLSGIMGSNEPMIIEIPEMPEMPELAPLMDMPNWNGLAPEHREEMRREMEELRREMDDLREELRGRTHREMRITIERKELTPEETAVLRGKGVPGLDSKLDLGEVRCFPNPSDGFFRLQFDVPTKGDLNVDVHDSKGDRVYHESISDYEGAYERTLNLSTKADGTYYLVVTQGGKAYTQKLVKE